MNALIAALRFLTRLPIPGPATRAADLPFALAWFPLVGALCGAALGGTFIGLAHGWPVPVAAVLAIAVGLLLTGGFHEDAVSDAADGLGGGTDTERVLAIMKDSRIGAYGAMALWVLLTLRWTTLTQLDPAQVITACALAGAWGRWTAAPLILLPALGNTGLSKDISQHASRLPLVIATILVVIATLGAWWLGVERAPWAALAALLTTGLWAFYLRQRLGGQSGDLLGAGNQIAEAAVLVTLLAH